MEGRDSCRKLSGAVVVLILALLAVLFWHFRIVAPAVRPGVRPIGNGDIYKSHIPMLAHAFATLRSGHLPMWNPYQLCGEPFLAIPYVGLLYPLNLLYLYPHTPVMLEVSLVLHLLLGMAGMWLLLRHFSLGQWAAFCGAVTFGWSGFAVQRALNQPSLHAAIVWIPLVALTLDRVMLGKKRAWMLAGLAIACQLLTGAMEVFLHSMYVGALFVVVRALNLARAGEWKPLMHRATLALACVGLGLGLAAAQLLPTVELVRLSTRAGGSLTYAQVAPFGSWIWPQLFFRQALSTDMSLVTVGLWPLLAMLLFPDLREHRVLWFLGLVSAAGAAFLVFGGWAYRLYFHLPVLGSLFRRPNKFLDIYIFGQALLAGAGIARLQAWAASGDARVWRHPAWILCVCLAVSALGWLAWTGQRNGYLFVFALLVLLVGCVKHRRLRTVCVAGICCVQGISLFFGVGNKDLRPFQQPEVFQKQARRMHFLPGSPGLERVYLSQRLSLDAALAPKQGMDSRVLVVNDYEPLAVARYASFFTRATGRKVNISPFFGQYIFGAHPRWRLMDLTGTRYYFLRHMEIANAAVRRAGREFRHLRSDAVVNLFRKQHTMPRAYFVPRARVLSDPERVLATLESPTFDPHQVVLLEGSNVRLPENTSANGRQGAPVSIRSYEAERVVIDANVQTPGFLVLTDLFYPGWKAIVDGHDVPIYRANYLFRAVRLDPGSTEVRFEYRPASFRIGLSITVATALLMFLLFVRGWRRETSYGSATAAPGPAARP